VEDLETSRGDAGFEVLIAVAKNKYLLGCNGV
jgi:hypothetical protein